MLPKLSVVLTIFLVRVESAQIVFYSRNDNDNDNEICLFRHHNGNNTNIKVIFKQMTMLDKCNCI